MLLLVAACGGEAVESLCADVVDATFMATDEGVFTVAVTVRSDDVGWEGYADRWELLVADTAVAQRVLTHPHVEEQPFTRSLSGVELGGGTATMRAHHSTGGFCGDALTVSVPG